MTHTADFHVVATTQVQAEKTFRPLNALGQWLRHALDELLVKSVGQVRPGGSSETGATPASAIAKQGELRNRQNTAAHV